MNCEPVSYFPDMCGRGFSLDFLLRNQTAVGAMVLPRAFVFEMGIGRVDLLLSYFVSSMGLAPAGIRKLGILDFVSSAARQSLLRLPILHHPDCHVAPAPRKDVLIAVF